MLSNRTAGKRSSDRAQEFRSEWRRYVGSLGSQERLQRFGSAIAAFDEKLAQGSDLFSQESNGMSRLRRLLARHVVDEGDLRQSMQAAFDRYQDALIEESIALYVKAGVDRETASNLLAYHRVAFEPPKNAFEPLLRKAKSLAESDWFRTGGILVGSNVLADSLHGDSEEGGWLGMLSRFATEIAIDTALDYATDPGARFAEELKREWSKAEAVVLDGQQGLFAALEKATKQHVAMRQRHLLATDKGGAK